MTITPYESAPLTEAESADLEHLEAVIDQGLQTFYLTGAALATIRDTRLYRQNHATFEDYCRDRWGMVRRNADFLIGAAGVVKNIENHGSQILPANERQARPLDLRTPPPRSPSSWRDTERRD